jgi:hypothetical protein
LVYFVNYLLHLIFLVFAHLFELLEFIFFHYREDTALTFCLALLKEPLDNIGKVEVDDVLKQTVYYVFAFDAVLSCFYAEL